MKIKSIILFLTCLLLLSSFTASATACCEPPAPPCHHCEDTVWVNDCDSADCESCVDSNCVVCDDDPNQVCCDGTCCDTDECECVDGECLCCWTLEEHPEGTGDCSCSEATGHCGTSIQAWSISTCERSSSGSKYCNTTYRQVGSRYACDESTDWVNVFLCYSGQAAECIAICSAGLALCIVDPPSCPEELNDCYQCMLEYIEGEPEDCGCLVVICDVGAVTHTLWANAGTLSGGNCP